MKTITTNRITSAYLHKLGRMNGIITISAIIFVVFSFFWMLFRVGGHEGTNMIGNVVYILAAFSGAILSLITSYRLRFGPLQLEVPYWRAWLYCGLGQTFITIGGVCYVLLQLNSQPLMPSLADLFFNVACLLMLIGLLSIPTITGFRFRTVVDVSTTTLCFLGIVWAFVLGPIYFSQVSQSHTFPEILKLIFSISYPCWDVILILVIVSLIQRHIEPALYVPLVFIGLGTISSTWADITYAYTTTISNTYQTGTFWIDPFWLIGDMLIGLAGLHQYLALARKVRDEQEHTAQATSSHLLDTLSLPVRGWRYLQSALVYIPLVILLVLLVFSAIRGHTEIENGLVFLVAIAGSLVAIRYFLTTHENDWLLREREQGQLEAERSRSTVTQLTGIFEMDRLRQDAVLLVKTELGFDAAMLLFTESYNLPLDLRPRVSVIATSKDIDFISNASTILPTTSWQFYGDNILYRTLVSGKMKALQWNRYVAETPSEIRNWQQQQRITTMDFLPVSYQGRILACLGVARSSDQPLNQRDLSILTTYTNQLATLIEHARLYQETREHEAFAKALANVATRLNEAVVEPIEIGQLICAEGARALRADYTLLYIKDPKNELRLVPLCVHIQPEAVQTNSPRGTGPLITPVTDPQQWPPILLHEYEGQALHTPQPTLVYISQPQATPSQQLPTLTGMLDTKRSSSGLLLARETRNRRNTSLLREMLSIHFVPTAILAPLATRGEPVGILVFARSHLPGGLEKPALDVMDLPHAQDFSEQAGVVFTNAQLYQSLSQAHERLKELDQMKDQFMVTASHELRTPLTAVQGYIELMAEYDAELPPEQRREFLQKARRGCDELAVLLGNVMDASRLDGEMNVRPALLRRVSVDEIIDSVIILIEPHLTKEQRMLHKHIPPHLFVQADPVRLRQVLMNVCTNALKYSQPGTPIGFSARTAGPCVIISISDKGKGVKPEHQAHIFQRFYRIESDVNSPVRGSGLGLYIAHRLIAAMGGKIWIESLGIPDQGSTFHIQLPMLR
jgi:signal transduction histidine kinase